MTRNADLRVGMINARGLKYTAQEIESWIMDDRLNITALSEIKMTPGSHPGISLDHELITGPHSRGNATSGGVAIIIYGMAKHKLVLKLRESYAQAVGVKIRDVTYVAIYLNPEGK